jgi:F0F1-type ATP synthase assembly protein I
MPPIIKEEVLKTVNKLASMTPEEKESWKKTAQEQATLRAQELAKKTQEENNIKITELQKQNRNRNLWIAGGMVVGAVGGFFIARYFKAKTLGLVLSTVGGSVAVGVPIILATRKKAVARRTEIETLKTTNNAVATTTSVIDNAIKTVENITSVIPKTPLPAGSGVLTVEEQNKLMNQPKMA